MSGFTQDVNMNMKCYNTLSVAACSALNTSECGVLKDGAAAVRSHTEVKLYALQKVSADHDVGRPVPLPPTFHHKR